jgi:hypothetical protein
MRSSSSPVEQAEAELSPAHLPLRLVTDVHTTDATVPDVFVTASATEAGGPPRTKESWSTARLMGLALVGQFGIRTD